MTCVGYAYALGACTIINAIATWKGSAFGIDLKTRAQVKFTHSDDITGQIDGGGNPYLIKRCVELVFEKFNYQGGAEVMTSSDIPMASGLKSSSAAANAAVLAALDVLGEVLEPLEAIRIGVQAALDAGVTITGAFDDAAASMLGGVVITDNRSKTLLFREEIESEVIIYSPDIKSFSAHTDVNRSVLIAPWIDLAYDLSVRGEYKKAMTLNGFLYCSTLGFNCEPMLIALETGITGVSLSGTGPSYAALADSEKADMLVEAWSAFDGRVIRTKINNNGAQIGRS